MIEVSSLNWWAVIVCMVVAIVSGSLWFGPKTFFPLWWKGLGKTDQDVPGAGSNMGIVFGLTFVASFIQPLMFAVVLAALYPDGATLTQGIVTALVIWGGFIAPTYLVNRLFAGYPIYVWVLETGNHLLNFVLFGVILSLWQ